MDSASVPGYAVAARLVYSGLGALAYATGLTQQTSYEEFWTDAIGNRTLQSLYDGGTIYPVRRRALNIDALGRHTFVHDTLPAPADTAYLYEYQTAYDGSGNVDRNWGREDPGYQGSTTIEWARLSYFSADEKLRVFNNRATNDFGVYEEYRYDALGRRVLVRTRDTGDCAAPHTSQCGHIERIVWDGDQVLYEIRARGGDSATSAQLENDADVGIATVENRWGRVAYQHAGGIDLPLSVIRMNMDGQPNPLAVSPHTNWQGDFEVGSWMDGSSTANCQPTCPSVPFPGGRLFADGGAPPAGMPWFGNLIAGKMDGSGLQYMRNRYYDPSTGRFTQQDPIGLGGGLNLYGFAAGDPVSYSDPFGLRAQGDDCKGAASVFECVGKMVQPIQRPLEIAGAIVVNTIVLPAEGALVGLELGSALLQRGIQANRARGIAAEAYALNELGLVRNTQAVRTAEGAAIPDALTNVLSVEVKHTSRVSLTRQLRIQTEAARAAERTSVLVTGPGTRVSGPARNAFDLFITMPGLGPQ